MLEWGQNKIRIHNYGFHPYPTIWNRAKKFYTKKNVSNSNMKDFQDGDWFLVDNVVRVVGVANSICASQQHLSNRCQHLFLTPQLSQLSIVLLHSSKTKLNAAYKNK
jgi:hypothetical protein